MVNTTPSISCSSSYPKPLPFQASSSLSPPPTFHLKFHTTYRQNLRYLHSLGITTKKDPSPESTLQILTTINLLKSRGFSEPHFSTLASGFPQLFSPSFDPDCLQPIFEFLINELGATPEESCGLILRCPGILKSNVQFCLRPTLLYLKELGLEKLNLPTSLNAHLLNTRVQKLAEKVSFLQTLGFSYDESVKMCARLPAIFGYSRENNLVPKFKYLLNEMERSLDEVKEFPQYFAFSLERRIVPRHLHLKQRNIRAPLKAMLLWSDQRFYARWK